MYNDDDDYKHVYILHKSKILYNCRCSIVSQYHKQMTEAITYTYSVLVYIYIFWTTEAEIQLPLRRLPDSSVLP